MPPQPFSLSHVTKYAVVPLPTEPNFGFSLRPRTNKNGFSSGVRFGEPAKRPTVKFSRGACAGIKPGIDDPARHQHILGWHWKEVCSRTPT